LKRLSIMQPYFLPYLGYFQLIAASDEFVVYDDIKYTKKGWINRNRFLRNGTATTFTLPLRAAPDNAFVVERDLAESFDPSMMLRQFEGAYGKAPHFAEAHVLLKDIILHEDRNLFRYLLNSLRVIGDYLGIKTPIRISSEVTESGVAKGQDRVLGLCNALNAGRYLNLPGGQALYDPSSFADRGIELEFLTMRDVPYPQAASLFVPKLSIVDLLMHVDRDTIAQEMLSQYTIERAEPQVPISS